MLNLASASFGWIDGLPRVSLFYLWHLCGSSKDESDVELGVAYYNG